MIRATHGDGGAIAEPVLPGIEGSRSANGRAGCGRIEWTLVDGRTVPTRLRANSPLKLLAPRQRAASSWVFASTFGGGLLAGDQVALNVAAGPGTTCFLGTQASTKVYRSPARVPSRQTLDAAVAQDALCVVAPDPLTCFAGAVFEQRQRFDLAPTGGLVLLDWLTSGRRAAGERWAFSRYDSRIDVRIAGRPLVRDALLLDPADGALDRPQRMGRFDCIALLLLVGPPMREPAAAILRFVGGQPVRPGAGLIFSASPLGDGGAIVRLAAADTESAAQWLRDRLEFLPGLLGGDPSARTF